jgi:hypothetical protein
VKNKFICVAAILASVMSPFCAPSHVAASTLDQEQTLFSATSGFADVQMLAQTFTVGITGQLSTIAVNLCCSTSEITLNLLQVSGGVPTTSIIATAVATTPSNSGTLTYFDFTNSNISVFAGETLAFEPSSTVGGSMGIDIAYNAPNPYSGGELFYTNLSQGVDQLEPFVSQLTGQGPIGGVDAQFATYVSPTTPIPAALPLFATGLGGLGLLGWRRKQKAQAVA